MADWDALNVLVIVLICFWFNFPTNDANVVAQSERIVSSRCHELDEGDGQQFRLSSSRGRRL